MCKIYKTNTTKTVSGNNSVINSMSGAKIAPCYKQLMINNIPIEIEIDTDSCLNLMSLETLKTINKHPAIEPHILKLSVAN